MRVEGMDCASCAIKIENALKRVAGVTEVNVSASRGTVIVKHDLPDTETLRVRIVALGYKVIGTEHVV
jgi:Cd2+/Zn2+-exporting ATPase